MADITNLSQFLSDVADAIRTKKETTEQIPAENFDQEILSIETGSQINNQDKEITENGTYTADEGYTGLGNVIVDVSDPEYDANLLLTEQILGIKDIQYIPISYIESTGVQWIDTGYKATVNTKIELCVMTTISTTTSQFNQITGAKQSYHDNSAVQVATNPADNAVLVDYGTGGTEGTVSIPKNTKFNIVIGNNSIYVDDKKYTQSGEFSGTCPYSLWIFDCNDAGKNEKCYVGRLYYYKIYENNVLVRDFIPVMRYSNGDKNYKCGLYDKVENKFYHNKGSIPFVAGIEPN